MASRSVLVNGNRAATFLTAPEPARVGAVSCSQVRGRASRYQSRAIGMLDGGAAASSGKTLRILLVDDSPADRELVKRAFREPAPPTGPLDLEVVTDAEAALTAVRKATFAVILTDYSLPGRNGLELLRALRETGDKTPVVMMTGLGDESVAVAALQHGAADYVIKEIGFERALPVVIDRVLGKRTLALDVERRQRQVAQYGKQFERQVEDQTVALRRALQESEALRRVSRALAAARELKPALDLVTQATAQLLRARAAAVIIRAEAERVLVSVWGALKEAPGLKNADLLAALGRLLALAEGDDATPDEVAKALGLDPCAGYPRHRARWRAGPGACPAGVVAPRGGHGARPARDSQPRHRTVHAPAPRALGGH